MAVERLVRRICDRCNKPIDEAPMEYSEPEKSAEKDALPIVYLEYQASDSEGQAKIEFRDLHDKCRERVMSLIGQIKLDKPEDDKQDTAPSPPPKNSRKKKGKGDEPDPTVAPPADASEF